MQGEPSDEAGGRRARRRANGNEQRGQEQQAGQVGRGKKSRLNSSPSFLKGLIPVQQDREAKMVRPAWPVQAPLSPCPVAVASSRARLFFSSLAA